MRLSTVCTFAVASLLYSSAVAIPLQFAPVEVAARSPLELHSRDYSLEARDVFNELVSRYNILEARHEADGSVPIDGDTLLHLLRRATSSGSGGQPSGMPNGQPQNPANAPSTKPRLPSLKIPSMPSSSGSSSSSGYFMPSAPRIPGGETKPDSPNPYNTPSSAAPPFPDPRSPRAALIGNNGNGKNHFYNPSSPVQNFHALTAETK